MKKSIKDKPVKMKYILYPGCVPSASDYPVLKAFKKLSKKIDFKYAVEPAFSCCGATHLQERSIEKSLLVNARNLALAEQKGQILITICNTCQLSLSEAKTQLDKNIALRERVNNLLSEEKLPPYTGKIQVMHFLYAVDKHLRSMKVVPDFQPVFKKLYPYYGCHLLRPSCFQNSSQFEDSKNPHVFSDLLEYTGAETVTGKFNLDCCGFHRLLTKKATTDRLTGKILDEASELGADAVITTCPLCKFSLENHPLKPKSLTVLHLEEYLFRALS